VGLIFDLNGICVKEIEGAAINDVPDSVEVERPVGLNGVDLKFLLLVDGVVIQRDETAGEIAAREEAAFQKELVLGILKALFNHENRIRALEGKTAVTIDQFRIAVKTILGLEPGAE
jgi:hypothetical protein